MSVAFDRQKPLTIGTLAKRFGLSRSTLLYYESEGLVSPAGRSRSNYRLYDASAIDRLQRVVSYRAAGVPLDDIRRMLDHSDFLFGYATPGDERLIGFARVLSDRVYKALIFDLIVDPQYRNAGIGRRLMEVIVHHPELRRVKHFELYCLPEMEAYYGQWGFTDKIGDIKLLRREPIAQSG